MRSRAPRLGTPASAGTRGAPRRARRDPTHPHHAYGWKRRSPDRPGGAPAWNAGLRPARAALGAAHGATPIRPDDAHGCDRYRPDLPPPTPDIDRSSALSTGASVRRPRISTGARRDRPMAPARRPRISTGGWRYRPMAPPAGLGYRPELGVIDLRLRPPAADIDRRPPPRSRNTSAQKFVSPNCGSSCLLKN